MRLLLDTHALLWFLAGDVRKLSDSTRSRIADRRNDVMVSVVSFWELAIKVRIGKLDADPATIVRQSNLVGFATLTLLPRHIVALASLDRFEDHKDPFDHMLIAQARAEQATMVSQDNRMARYPIPLLRCTAATADHP